MGKADYDVTKISQCLWTCFPPSVICRPYQLVSRWCELGLLIMEALVLSPNLLKSVVSRELSLTGATVTHVIAAFDAIDSLPSMCSTTSLSRTPIRLHELLALPGNSHPRAPPRGTSNVTMWFPLHARPVLVVLLSQ